MSAWFQILRVRPEAKARIFAFAHAGAGASFFRSWNDLLPDWVELVALQLPGREGRMKEAPLSTVAEVVREVSAAFAEKSERPFVLYGHSLGAVLAFETARSLVVPPVHLFVSGRIGPDCAPVSAPLHELPDDELIETVGRRYGAIPDVILKEPELLALLLPALRADLTIVEQYRGSAEPKLDVPITAFSGNADPLVSRADLEAWGRHTTGAFVARIVDGGHFFVSETRKRAVIVRAMLDALR